MPPSFLRAYPPAQPAPGSAFWLPFQGGELLAQPAEEGVALLQGGEDLLAALEPGPILYLGTLDGVPCITCEVAVDAPLPEDWRKISLRGLFGQLPEPAYGLADYATQLLYWRRHNGFCASCGQPTEQVAGDWGRRCSGCGHTSYPHVSPAIIVLIHDGDRVLLTHKAGWGPRYSIIAGFVEPGESLEQCVHREVYEEVGVEVEALQYISSQSWPYPHQLMVGYMARYTSGEIRLDLHELDDGAWFHVDSLPELPGPLSISRQLIDAWVSERRGKH